VTWFRVDDGLHSNIKVAKLKPAVGALHLWVIAASWCSREENDGWLPIWMVKRLGCNQRQADDLCRVNLWEKVARDEDGYQFVNWTKYNPSKEKLAHLRAQTAERQGRFRETKTHPKKGASNAVTNENKTRESQRPIPSQPDPMGNQLPTGWSDMMETFAEQDAAERKDDTPLPELGPQPVIGRAGRAENIAHMNRKVASAGTLVAVTNPWEDKGGPKNARASRASVRSFDIITGTRSHQDIDDT
jgi:hypothetical protein